MKSALHSIVRFLANEDGPTAVEYAVMLALIIIVCLASVLLLGENTSGSYTNSATSIQNAMKGSK